MKKCIAIIVIMLLIVAVADGVLQYKIVTEVRNFDVSEYSEYIEDYSLYESAGEPEYIGSIPDAKTLKTLAYDLWMEIYGERMKDEKPYIVYYDEVNRVWHIKGTMPFSLRSDVFGLKRFGGVAHLIVQETDGKVLALWHDK